VGQRITRMKTVRKKFADRFADLVRTAEKRQTVRPLPKRARDIPEAGDVFVAERWKGKPYRSKVEEIRRGTVTRCTTFKAWRVFDTPRLRVNGINLTRAEAEAFAKADGFKSALEFVQWFDETHGVPFFGMVIFWKPTKNT
jgi:hypothetical protein